MVFTETEEEVLINLPSQESYIYVAVSKSVKARVGGDLEEKGFAIVWKSYQIKESDFRIKTATFVTPQYLDVSAYLHTVLITSPYHENFHGIVLSNEYDEEKGLYTYKCQDWSRKYMSKTELVLNGDTTTYNIIRCILSYGECSIPNPNPKGVYRHGIY